MKKYLEKFSATREISGPDDEYQTLDVEKDEAGRLRIELMVTRWRDPAELADYLRWAAFEIEAMGTGPIKGDNIECPFCAKEFEVG